MMATTLLTPPPAAPAELDALTIARAAKGDRAATRALVERYQRPVFALISRVVGRDPPARVEDLAQETFLRVFKALPGFRVDGPAKLSTWILTIATRLALDAKKRRVPRPHAPDATSAARPDDRIADRQALSAVERAVADLPEGQRAALVLRVFHDLDYPEIAAALDVDVGTVKSRISRARAHLRAATEGAR